MTMTAKIAGERQNAKNLSGDKEEVSRYQTIAYVRGGNRTHCRSEPFTNPVTVRCWMGRSSQASTVYASIWVSTKDGKYTSGHGSAGGYGYCKESAAIDEAIKSAGIKLRGSPYNRAGDNSRKPCSIAGVGQSAVRAAIEAITRAAGYKTFTII